MYLVLVCGEGNLGPQHRAIRLGTVLIEKEKKKGERRKMLRDMVTRLDSARMSAMFSEAVDTDGGEFLSPRTELTIEDVRRLRRKWKEDDDTWCCYRAI